MQRVSVFLKMQYWRLTGGSKGKHQTLYSYRRKKLGCVCGSFIGFMVAVQACSLFVGHLDQEALSYRGAIRFKVPEKAYQQAALAKLGMPTTKAFKRATAQTLQQHLPIWVISLARATERRETMVKTLAAAGITNYELVDAVDSRNTTAVSKAMLNRYVHGWRRYMWHHNRTRYTSKIAVDLSHYCLWERIAAGDQPALILEDDVRLTGTHWTQSVLTALNELPQDWDVFYLASCCGKILGSNISQHLVPVYGTAGAFAYVMTPSFARRAIKVASSAHAHAWLDLLLMSLGRHFEANMYLAEPPLVQLSGVPTTLSHYSERETDIRWERLWIRYGHIVG